MIRIQFVKDDSELVEFQKENPNFEILQVSESSKGSYFTVIYKDGTKSSIELNLKGS